MEQKFIGLKAITVNYPLSDSELAKLSRLIAGKLEAKNQLVEEKKSVAKDYASRIEMLDTAINKLKSEVNSGHKEQEVMAECYLDYERKVRVYRDKNTGEEIKIAPMEHYDMQLKAFPDQEITGEIQNETVYGGGDDLQTENGGDQDSIGQLKNAEDIKVVDSAGEQNQAIPEGSIPGSEQELAGEIGKEEPPITTGSVIPAPIDEFEPLPEPIAPEKPKKAKKNEEPNV